MALTEMKKNALAAEFVSGIDLGSYEHRLRVGSIAGWNSPPVGQIASALELIAQLCEADVCQLVWRASDGRLVVLDGAHEASIVADALVDSGWLDEVAEMPPGTVARVAEGVSVTPVLGPGGVPSGALGLRGPADREAVVHFAEVGGLHINSLLSISSAHADRSTAYEALFEIGTQIQAQESHPESIFSLIVERACELLLADCTWMALGEESSGHLHIEVTSGIRSEGFTQMKSAVGIGIGGLAIKERRTIVVGDLTGYRAYLPKETLDRLDAEGVVSMVCAPMLRDDGMLGALFVASRTRRQFNDEEAQLISALAAQAAVTIQNSRLYEDLSERNETLETSFSIHRRLTEAVLAGDGLHGVSAELAHLVDRDLLLCLVKKSTRYFIPRGGIDGRGPEQPDSRLAAELEETAVASLPIVAGEDELGSIHLLGEGEVSPLQHKALEHGATIIALELVKEQAALEVAWRLQGELLEELLGSSGSIDESLAARAEYFGVDLSRERRLAILAPARATSPSALLEFIRRTAACRPGAHPLVAQRGDRVLVAIADETPGEAVEFVATMKAKAGRAGLSFRAGISNAGTDMRAALREATGALALALRAPEDGTLIAYEDLGPLRFMLDAPDTSGMVSLVRQTLGPLSERDASKRSELLPTLHNFLDCGGHQRSTAAACHIHVSTLKYRLGQVAEILECDLQDPKTRFRLTLALEVLGVLELAGVAPFETKAEPASEDSRVRTAGK